MRQDDVLLRLVEAVNLVYEQDGAPKLVLGTLSRLLHQSTQVGHSRGYGTDGIHVCASHLTDQ